MSPSSTSSSDPQVTGFHPSYLIVTPPYLAKGPVRRTTALVITGLFLTIIFGTLAVDLISPVPPPKLMGREKDTDDKKRAGTNWKDGTLTELLEYDIRLTSRVRRYVMPRYAVLLFRFLSEARSAARIGTDGWAYLGERVDLLNRPPVETVDPAVAIIAAVDRRFASRGIHLIAVPVPRKSEVYPEHLPRGFNPHRELYGMLIGGLDERGINRVDLRSAFGAVKDRVLYYVVDSHWNDDGQLVAAEEIAKVGGIWVAPEQRDTEVRYVDEKPDPGDILRMIGIDTDSVGDFDIPRPVSKRFDVASKGGKMLQASTEAKDPPRIAVSGTSFTAHTRFPKYIRHFTNQGVDVYAWPGAGSVEPLRRLVAAVVEKKKLPATVIWEIQAHDIFCVAQSLRGAGNVFAELAPSSVTPLTKALTEAAAPFAKNCPLKPGTFKVGSKSLTAWTTAGKAIFAADGAAAVRLRGTVTGRPLEVTVTASPVDIVGQWRPGQSEVVLPILGSPTPTALRVAVRGDGGEASLDLKSLDVVLDVDAERAHKGVAGPPLWKAGSFEQKITFGDAAVAAPRHAFAVLKLRVEGGFDGKLDIEVVAKNGQSSRATFSALAPEAVVMLSLDDVPEGRLSALIVRGATVRLARTVVKESALFVPSIVE